jgi:hypothetical protein
MVQRRKKRRRFLGTAVVYPVGVEQKLGCSKNTRRRMERDGRLPPRDFFIGGKAIGWRPDTLATAFAGGRSAAA